MWSGNQTSFRVWAETILRGNMGTRVETSSERLGLGLQYPVITVATYRISGLRSFISTSAVIIPRTSLVPASLRAMVPDEAKMLEGRVTDWIGG